MFLINKKNAIIAIPQTEFEELENGYLVDGIIYPNAIAVNKTVPEGVVPDIFSYTQSKGFYENQEYKQSAQRAIDQIIAEKDQEKQAALNQMALEILMGGK